MNLDAIRNGVSLPDLAAKLPKIPTASAVSGLIVAALILMTPNPWFEAFIVETGLPGLVSAAEPPLGARARIVFALIAALIVTLGAWIALIAIVGRKLRAGTRFAMPDEEGEDELSGRARSLRRADAHPDAPYRRPIMAEDDLGTPLDLVTVAPDDADESTDDFDALDLGEVAEIVEDDPPTVAADEPVAATPEDDTIAGTADPAEEEPAASEPVFEIPLPRRDRDDAVPSDTTIEPAVEPVPRAARATSSPDARTELAELVARLEAGLERKKTVKERRNQAEARPAENVTPHPQARRADDHDAALRQALSALQQVAGKGG
ncbi:hypothetical protein HFP57_17760 [Parasphingopyxis algicola]|uniref:hypothetical protein n=1 Tax=Parasphingopyxis algicola TaxID=2026624 RepID=UPI0015A124D7|nr:hypothetical protein [Parasphingopyxis algicola]QLC26700.1 hypothetical protein HFP57_17760 [Parasphingopyxis algicola]